MPIKFEPNRFQSAARYYVPGRLNYPASLIQRVAERTGLTAQERVLDLGCGPGFLAAAFAPHAGEVFGVDPAPAMLREAEQFTAEAGVRGNTTFLQGSSYDLSALPPGLFRLVTIGRAFHWMDRAATLKELETRVLPGGAVALFEDSHCKAPENPWRVRFQELLEPFITQDESYAARHSPDWCPHLSFLLRSRFNQVERIGIIQKIETPVERLLDRVLSQSITSEERLGAQRGPLLEKLRRLLAAEAVDGYLTEVVEFSALLGTLAP
ncbi:MAG: methyltransferase domain-containing protein [Puniceicoccales bacterium]|nr:methyltransferase domain-containing protein [Puniceicoccales bacterium]